MAVNNILRPDEWDATNGMRPYPERCYYEDAFRADLTVQWGDTEFSEEVKDLAFYRMLTSFYNGTVEDVEDRRRLLFYYMRREFSTENADDALIRLSHQLPIQTFIPRVLRNLCLAYKQPPQRTWGTDNDAEAFDELFDPVYREMHFNRKMQEIYRLAKLCNTVAVRPLVNPQTKEMEVHYMTPDIFRVNTVRGTAVEVYYQISWNNEPAIRVWTKDEAYVLGLNNKRITDKDIATDQPATIANPYGRLPFVFLQIIPPLSEDWYGGGMFSLVEDNLKANKREFSGDVGATMNAFGVWVGTNTQMNEKGVSITPDKVILGEGIRDGEGQDLPPHIEHVVGNSLFQSVRDDKRTGQRDAMRNAGIPASQVEETAGLPASGISRVMDRAELLEQRDEDKLPLSVFEEDFSQLLVTVADVDGYEGNTLPSEHTFNIDYAEEKIFLEPEIDYEYKRTQAKNGDMSLSQYARDVMGIDEPDEEKVAAMISERKAMWKEAQGPEEEIMVAPEQLDDESAIETPLPDEEIEEKITEPVVI